MTAAELKKLKNVEAVLKSIGRTVQGFESDFERIDAIAHGVNAALEDLFDLTADECEEIPAGMALPAAA